MSNKPKAKTQDQDSDMHNADQPIMVVCKVTVVNPDGSLETMTGPFLRIGK
jgi:hypothetical protein